ncbi:hypothetical protein [Salinarimonas rosea]|uniref:hypothetical protein n=1 Tax=Salinarimonas rosea TaxID=552063 RepID=UPI001FD873D2|nr:hypothetical protein [Salinarimonas rosea]
MKEREKILADAIQGVAAELRLVDLAVLARYVHAEQHGNIDDLVASSTELFFKPGTLRYGLRADVDLRWGGTPAVSLDLEFAHQDVTVFFNLVLGSLNAGVDIQAVTFDGPPRSPQDNTRRLAEALADARIAPWAAGAANQGEGDGDRA